MVYVNKVNYSKIKMLLIIIDYVVDDDMKMDATKSKWRILYF